MRKKPKYTQATIRFMMPVYQRIREQAEANGLTIASWIRVAAIEKLEVKENE